jgi:hypothetical protein
MGLLLFGEKRLPVILSIYRSDAVLDYIWVRLVHSFADHLIKKPSMTSTAFFMPEENTCLPIQGGTIAFSAPVTSRCPMVLSLDRDKRFGDTCDLIAVVPALLSSPQPSPADPSFIQLIFADFNRFKRLQSASKHA